MTNKIYGAMWQRVSRLSRLDDSFGAAECRIVRSLVSPVPRAVRPLYQPTSLRSSGKYLVKVVHQSHRSKLEQHLSRKSLSARTIRVSRIRERDLQRLTTHNVVDITTPKGSMQVVYNIRPSDRPQISHFLNAVIANSSGRLVLLRGLPPGVVPSAVEARLSRAYALIEPVRCRVRCWNKETEGWDGLEVHPIMRLYTAYRSAGPSQWRRGEDLDDDGPRIRNSDLTADQDQLDIHLAHQDPDATANFLVRLKTSEDALRLCRSFHRKIWDSVPRKALRSRVRATLRRRGGFGSELPNFEEAAEDDDEAAAAVGDEGEAGRDEGRRHEKYDARWRTERSEDQEKWAAEYTRLLAREAESRSNARRYVVEAQIMY